MDGPFFPRIGAIVVLAAIHPLTAVVSRRHVRKRTISLCAGIALAYVFLHLLPELGRMQQELLESSGGDRLNPWFREHVYVMALSGLLLFQGVDSLGRKGVSVWGRTLSYRAELLFFALYDALIGYLIVGNAWLDHPTLLITVALAAHFFGTDLDLAERYGEVFVKRGSFVLAAATLMGTVLASLMNLGEMVLMVGFAFLAGGLLINTLRTELPEPENVKNLFLLLGAALYAVLLLFIYSVTRPPNDGEALRSSCGCRKVVGYGRPVPAATRKATVPEDRSCLSLSTSSVNNSRTHALVYICSGARVVRQIGEGQASRQRSPFGYHAATGAIDTDQHAPMRSAGAPGHIGLPSGTHPKPRSRRNPWLHENPTFSCSGVMTSGPGTSATTTGG